MTPKDHASIASELFADEPTGTTKAEGTVEPPPPGFALAVIDTLDNSALFASGGVTDAQLAAGREWYLTEAKKYDIETEEKRTEFKRFARPLQKLRTGIEARAKEFTGETKRKLAAIDTEKRRLVGIVGGIETEVLQPLTDWEQEEESRKVRLSGIANELAAKGQRIYMDITEIGIAINELEAFDVSTMQEYKISAESAITASLRVLKPELARRQEAERNAAELEELRAERAAREERDRQAEAKRQEDARIAEAAEKLAEKKVAEIIARKTAEIEAVIPATQYRTTAEVAEMTTPDWMEPSEPEEVVLPEPPQAPPPATIEMVDREHREAVNTEAACALVDHALIDLPAAIEVIAAIAKGLIPNVTITY